MTTQLEERLTRSLDQTLSAPDWPGGDLGVAIREGRRLRRRARLTAVAAVAATAVVAAGAWALLPDQAGRTQPAGPVGTWSRLPDLPLEARTAPLMAWTGDEVIVAGGDVGVPCPSTADCDPEQQQPVASAAAYDVASGTWRSLPDLPAPAADTTADLVVVDGWVIAVLERRWYVLEGNAWRGLPLPQSLPNWPRAVDGSTVWSFDDTGRMVTYEIGAPDWEVVPEVGLSDEFVASQLVASDRGMLALGEEYPDGKQPRLENRDQQALVGYVLEGDSWRRLPDPGIASQPFSWTGSRLVSGPFSDAVVLDPFTGESSTLSPSWVASEVQGSDQFALWQVTAAEGPMLADFGAVYDDRTGRAVVAGRPESEVDYGMSGVWGDGRLYFAGGAAEEIGYPTHGDLSAEFWVFTPPTD